MSLMITTRGKTIERLARSRPEQLTAKQLLNRRNEDWRYDHDEGRADPVTGRRVTRPVSLIAKLAGVSERTVRHGIAQARALRDAISHADL